MKEIQTSKGVLKYRMPNILEAYDILEASGITTGSSSTIMLKRNIIASMGVLLDFKELGFSSYEELLNDTDEMLESISTIADEVILKTFDAFKKK